MKPSIQKGQLTIWNDERGFGFIQPHAGGKPVFLHISALPHTRRRPHPGDIIRYQVATDQKGNVRAANAAIEGAPTERIGQAVTLSMQVGALALLPALGALHTATMGVPIPLFLYLVVSVLTFWLYAEDKAWAKANQRRVPEVVLHSCEFVGGWPGAFIAQRILRHKNRKQTYQVVFRFIVGVHLLFWVGWFVVALFGSRAKGM